MRRGEEVEALEAYQAAAASCRELESERQRNLWCQAAWLGRAATLERLGRMDEAARAYELIPDEMPMCREAAATALVSAASVHRRQGRAEHAESLYLRVIADYPDAVYADEAVRLLVATYPLVDAKVEDQAKEARRLYSMLEELSLRVLATPVGDNLLYAMATLAKNDLHDLHTARRLFEQLLVSHPDSPLYDDSLWYAAELARAAHDANGAVLHYRKLLATREHSLIIGSYHSIWLDDAQLAVAFLLRDELGRPKDALLELARVSADYPASVLLDDALYEKAFTHEKLGERDRACAALATLKKDFPDSRYLLELAPALAKRQACAMPGQEP